MNKVWTSFILMCLCATTNADVTTPSGSKTMDAALDVQLRFSEIWQDMARLRDPEVVSVYRALTLNARSVLELSLIELPHEDPELRISEQTDAFVEAAYAVFGSDFLFLIDEWKRTQGESGRTAIKNRAANRLAQFLLIVPLADDMNKEAPLFVSQLAVARRSMNDDRAFVRKLQDAMERYPREIVLACMAALEAMDIEFPELSESEMNKIARFRIVFQNVYRSSK